jgi:iron complex transport system permease protein
MNGRGRRAFTALVVLTLGLAAISVWVGPGDIGLLQALTVVVDVLQGQRADHPALHTALVFDLRLPRTLLAMLVGCALSAAGTVTQGLFRNPMADPGVLGISSGAAMMAVIGFSLGLDQAGVWATPLLAAVGAIGILVVLHAIARPVAGFATLLLSGIAIGALCSSIVTLVLALDTERWDLGLKIVRWLMGSFESRTWVHLGWGVLPFVVGLGLCGWLRLDLDTLQLGPETAASLGTDLRRVVPIAMLAVGLLVGLATALTGIIGFVGLVVPHVARLWVGAGHRNLLPTACVLGAATLLGVDLLTRAWGEVALPPGAITSLLGAPFFLWLLRRRDDEVAQ